MPAKTAAKLKVWGLRIGGKDVPAASGETYKLVNPATGEAFAEAASGGKADVDAAVRAASAAFPKWSALAPGERSRLLMRYAALVRERQSELAELETRCMGKTISDSKGEAEHVADTLEYYAGAIKRPIGETIPIGKSGFDFTFRQPYGVCGLILPWNYPMVIAGWKLGPALACGNAAVLKPAAWSPLTALVLADLSVEAGLPQGLVNVVTGPGVEAGQALAAHPGVPKVSFTGSTKTGAAVQKAGADLIKRVTLELGGKSPNVVFDDADLDACVEASVGSMFGNAGQDCCARSRSLVHKKVYDRFLSAFVERTQKLRVGDPMDPKTEVGPLASEERKRVVAGYIEAGKAEGAKLVCGGEGKGNWIQPAVFDRAKPSMRVFQEEIFGPVVVFTPFSDEDEAVELANATAYGLSGSVWTRDIGRALRVARRVQSGNLSVNSASSVFLEAPFGGLKQSGLGRELGMRALESYSEVRNIYLSDK